MLLRPDLEGHNATQLVGAQGFEIAEWQTYINGRFAESDRIIRARKGFMKKAAYNGFPRQQVITLMPTNPRCKPQQ